MYIAEVFLRCDSVPERFGTFYIRRKFYEIQKDFLDRTSDMDWIDTIEELEKTVDLSPFMEIFKECRTWDDCYGKEPKLIQSDIYYNVEGISDKLKDRRFINQCIIYTENGRIAGYISFFEIDKKERKRLKDVDIVIHDYLRETLSQSN